MRLKHPPAPSDDVTEASRLGKLLVQMLVVKPRQVDAALELQQRTGQNIGEALIELGAASAAHVQVAASLQAQMREGDVLGACSAVLRRAYRRAGESAAQVRAAAEAH